jgi:hypothetical protein
MTALELANLLLKAPDAHVRIVVSPDAPWPLELGVTNVALNNEANAWVLSAPAAVAISAGNSVISPSANPSKC